MSKFSDEVASNMNTILKNDNFQKIFSKTASVNKVATNVIFKKDKLETEFPEASSKLPALLSDASVIFFNDENGLKAGVVFAKTQDGKVFKYNTFDDADGVHGTWAEQMPEMKVDASNDENVFETFANLDVLAAKKKKEKKDDDKDDKKSKKTDKKDKVEKADKSDKKSKKDDEDDAEEEDEKPSKKSKKSKKDEDENDAMALIFAAKKSKEDKKDGDDSEEDEEETKPKAKGKKKPFPFWLKKKKAGATCPDSCDCSNCMDSDDEVYASALRHIVDSFTKTSMALDNMGLEKSSIATMAILNHIIEEAMVKMAKEPMDSVVHVEEKIKHLKDKFKKMHEDSDSSGYDTDAADELDERITKLEKHLKDLKKNEKDSNDVRGTDLLLGLDDPEAQEGFLDESMDDPHSSAALEEILHKNPGLVDDIAPRLKNRFNDEMLEKQLKERIKSRLPSIIETPENTNIDDILKAYHFNVPTNKVPSEMKETVIPGKDLLKTKIDELNSNDVSYAINLVDNLIKEADGDYSFEDSGDTKVTKEDLKSILDVLGGYSDEEIKHREMSANPSDLDAYSKEYYDAAEKM